MDGDRGAAILTEFRTPLGSLRMPGFAGPGGIPLMAEFPAPADPAIGVPTKPWVDAEADIPTITVSARASLLEALNMKNSFFFGLHEIFQALCRRARMRDMADEPQARPSSERDRTKS
jgi:hypothetical protein